MFRINGELVISRTIDRPEEGQKQLWDSYDIVGSLPFEPEGRGKTVTFNAEGIILEMVLQTERLHYDADDGTFHVTFHIAHQFDMHQEAEFKELVSMVRKGLGKVGFHTWSVLDEK